MKSPGLALALLCISAAVCAQEPKALALADCYRLALRKSETIALQAERIEETEGRFQQALAQILPSLFFHSTDKRQDSPDGSSSAFTRKKLPERKFTLAQPLFSGFKEFAAMRGSKSEKRLREQEKERAEQLLLVDVANAFHLLLEQREDIRVLDITRWALRERSREMEDRERIGRSRMSEGVAVRAHLHRVEAEWESAQSRETVARQLLQFLTGLSAIGDLKDPGPSLPDPLSEEQCLAMAPMRPDVRAAEASLEIARQQMRAARAQFFPTVDTEANLYVERSGAAKEVEWDASFNVDVPLFQGGTAAGATKEASSLVRQAELRLKEVRRRADWEIRDSRAEYERALARVRALTQALEATEESYQMQAEEYRLNLVSNLDVLEALELLQDARRDLVQALQEAHRIYWRLQSNSPDTLRALAQPQ